MDTPDLIKAVREGIGTTAMNYPDYWKLLTDLCDLAEEQEKALDAAAGAHGR